MIPSKENPLIRSEVGTLFAAEDSCRRARRLLNLPLTESGAHAAIDLIGESIARMEAARSILIKAFPARSGEPS